MVLTELKALGGDRFLAGISDGSTVKVTTAIIADLSLYPGMELTDEQLEELRESARFNGCRERALRIIGARPMSCKELYDRLTEKGEDPRDAARCVEWMLEHRFLDDAQYAAMTVRHYAAKGYGVGRIKNELFRRGVPRELWEDALVEMPEMDEKLYGLLCSRLRGKEPDPAAIKKATDALYRRGFSWEEIKAVVERYKEEHQEEYNI